MIGVFLYANALLYAVFAAWCTFAPRRTAEAMGYASLSASGQSEYLVVYGGLQLGLGLFFLYCARTGEERLGLLLALALYAPIVAYRVVTVGRFWPIGGATLWVAGLELALLLASVALWLGRGERA